MTELIRYTKSAVWKKSDLRAYNIHIVTDDVATFFENPDLPPPSVRQAILVNEDCPINGLPHREDETFFSLLKCTRFQAREKSAVVDFARHLLKMFDYDKSDRYIRTRKNIPLFIGGSSVDAIPDLCVVSSQNGVIIHLVQKAKRHLGRADPEPQLIAQAIAAFQTNNMRLSSLGLKPADEAIIPGIAMMGTAPTFYKISVTAALVEAVETSQYPAQSTTVHKLVPPVPQPARLQRDGMRPLNNRAVILGCFEAFKQFL